jgi:hypothetical protein
MEISINFQFNNLICQFIGKNLNLHNYLKDFLRAQGFW